MGAKSRRKAETRNRLSDVEKAKRLIDETDKGNSLRFYHEYRKLCLKYGRQIVPSGNMDVIRMDPGMRAKLDAELKAEAMKGNGKA